MHSLRIRQAMLMIASFYYNYTIIHFPGRVFGKLRYQVCYRELLYGIDRLNQAVFMHAGFYVTEKDSYLGKLLLRL